MIEFGERLNVTADGKRFRCLHLREGPVSYEDRGLGIEAVRRSTIEAANKTFIGKPLVLEHVSTRLNVTDEAVKRVTVGTVDAAGMTDDGWAFVEGPLAPGVKPEDLAGRNPSSGYNVLETGGGGRWNNVPYERELTAIEFHHLALCRARSRYEEADFRLNAVTNPQGEITMFKLKFWQKDPAKPDAQPVAVERDLAPETEIEVGGQKVRLNALVESHQATEAEKAKAKEKAASAATDATRENAITDETVVEVDGKPVTVAQLKASHAERQNAIQAAAAAAEEEKKKGRQDYDRLNAAAAGAGRGAPAHPYATNDGSQETKLKRGNY